MSTALPICPNCQSDAVMKNGRTRHQKQNYKCRDCGRQFVEDPQWRMISEETKGIIDRLLLEKLSLAGIARALEISELWVQQYVNAKYQQVEQEVQARPKPKRRLAVQMDELWSFVGNEDNKEWVLLALDAQIREIVGVHIGNLGLWAGKAGVAVDAPGLPPMWRSIQRFLVSLCGGLTQQTAGVQWAKKQEKPATLNASIAPCVSACRVWFVKACRFQRS